MIKYHKNGKYIDRCIEKKRKKNIYNIMKMITKNL